MCYSLGLFDQKLRRKYIYIYVYSILFGFFYLLFIQLNLQTFSVCYFPMRFQSPLYTGIKLWGIILNPLHINVFVGPI